MRKEWLVISNDPARRNFAKALSRIDLTGKQAERWYQSAKRHKATGRLIENKEVIENPYLLSELDQGTVAEGPIGFSTIDRAVIGEGTRKTQIPVNDARRHRGALAAVLRSAEAEGDTLYGADVASGSCGQPPSRRAHQDRAHLDRSTCGRPRRFHQRCARPNLDPAYSPSKHR